MIAEWTKLLILVGVAGIIGYLAQRTGLCMVRGVMNLRQGRPMMILAMLLCGICVWAIVPFANAWEVEVPLLRYDWHYYFGLGGLLFGLGAGINGGCGISTLSKLAHGEMPMAATVLGWIIGWGLWASLVSGDVHAIRLEETSLMTISIEVLVLAVATIWALMHSPQGRKLWLGIMAIGFLSGLLFMLQPYWPPSSLLQSLTNASFHDGTNDWPSYDRYLVMFALLTGMLMAAGISRDFVWQPSTVLRLLFHLLAGVIMGLGAAMAMGGNDTQLLLGLPGFSPAGILTVIFMIPGIYLGTLLQTRLSMASARA